MIFCVLLHSKGILMKFSKGSMQNLDGATVPLMRMRVKNGQVAEQNSQWFLMVNKTFTQGHCLQGQSPPPIYMRPHMSAGMSNKPKRGYCWLLTKKIGLFLFPPSDGLWKADPCSPVVMMSSIDFNLNNTLKQPTASLLRYWTGANVGWQNTDNTSYTIYLLLYEFIGS